VAGLEDGADTLRDDVTWDLVGRAEKAGVVGAGLLGQRLEAGARGQRRPRLVEADVPLGTDDQQLQVDTAGGPDGLLVGGAGGRQVVGVHVGPCTAAEARWTWASSSRATNDRHDWGWSVGSPTY
jgi:hypothetical protein